MAEEAFEYMIVLDDGETFGYLEGARVLKVPQRLTCNSEAPELPAPEELQGYIEENFEHAETINVVEEIGGQGHFIIQRID